MKKYTALPKTAEEITGIIGCTEFGGKVRGLDFYYSSDMNELAKEEKRIDLEIYNDGEYISEYDYTDKCAGRAWKKGWLKDIKEISLTEKTWRVGDSVRVKQFDSIYNLVIISIGSEECILLQKGGYNRWNNPIKVSDISEITREELNLMLGSSTTLLEE